MTMQRFQLRCYRLGHSPFLWDCIAKHPGQAIKIAAFTWPNHFFTFVHPDRDFPSFLA